MTAGVSGHLQLQPLDRLQQRHRIRTRRCARPREEQVALEEHAALGHERQHHRLDVGNTVDGVQLQRLAAVADHTLALEELDRAGRAGLLGLLQRVGHGDVGRLHERPHHRFVFLGRQDRGAHPGQPPHPAGVVVVEVGHRGVADRLGGELLLEQARQRGALRVGIGRFHHRQVRRELDHQAVVRIGAREEDAVRDPGDADGRVVARGNRLVHFGVGRFGNRKHRHGGRIVHRRRRELHL